MRAYLVVVLCLLSFVAVSQPKDPGGWQGAKWGATEEQVTKAFPGAVGPNKVLADGALYNGLELSTFKLVDEEFGVVFWFNKTTSKLSKVAIGLTEDNDAAYLTLYALLITKYGTPSYQEETTFVWVAGLTSISLARVKTGSTLGILLQYQQLAKEEAAKL